jgi:hypothetical protein
MGAGASVENGNTIDINVPLVAKNTARIKINGATTVGITMGKDGQVAVNTLSNRLVLFSDRTPDIVDFMNMVKVSKYGYSFNSPGNADELVKLIENSVASISISGKGFESIALANHGPKPSDDTSFEWAITKDISIKSVDELKDPNNCVRRVLEALGKATIEGGRVDLFACNLLASEEGKAIFKEVEALTKCNFAASTNKTGNPTSKDTDWVMESDNVDVKGMYFHDTSLFDGNFNFFEALFLSDKRLKLNITRIGESSSGIPVYTFQYNDTISNNSNMNVNGLLNTTTLYKGVMAQDLLEIGMENAVILDKSSGYYKVNYDLIDVDFVTVV